MNQAFRIKVSKGQMVPQSIMVKSKIWFHGTKKFLVNVRRLDIGYSNVNSLRNKFDQVKLLVQNWSFSFDWN